MRYRRAAILLVPFAIAAACKGSDTYVYSARRYVADAGCLEAYKSIDLVNGDSVSSKCAPNCFSYGGQTYTSTVCPPIPELATALDPESPECKAAVELYAVTCGQEAGTPEDAGEPSDDADAGNDVLDAAESGG